MTSQRFSTSSLPQYAGPIDVCAACGQSILTTPDDPPATLLCDVCLASLERRRALRPGTIAAIPPQGGLF